MSGCTRNVASRKLTSFDATQIVKGTCLVVRPTRVEGQWWWTDAKEIGVTYGVDVVEERVEQRSRFIAPPSILND